MIALAKPDVQVRRIPAGPMRRGKSHCDERCGRGSIFVEG